MSSHETRNRKQQRRRARRRRQPSRTRADRRPSPPPGGMIEVGQGAHCHISVCHHTGVTVVRRYPTRELAHLSFAAAQDACPACRPAGMATN